MSGFGIASPVPRCFIMRIRIRVFCSVVPVMSRRWKKKPPAVLVIGRKSLTQHKIMRELPLAPVRMSGD